MKPVLMLHELNEAIFDLPLENYTLTFDDGLYSQYYYFDRLKSINTEKIFFISSNIICNGQQSLDFPACELAHEKAFAGNTEDYMTLDQIKDLMKDPMVSIGGHSHYHKRLTDFDKITHRINHMVEDTKLMVNWFQTNLNFKPTKFCFPYNDDRDGMYKSILELFGFTDFYGRERIDVSSFS